MATEITADIHDGYLTTLYGRGLLVGRIVGDKKERWPDGTIIRSSSIVSIDGNIVTTNNSVYRMVDDA
jgi:hypothetical protein